MAGKKGQEQRGKEQDATHRRGECSCCTGPAVGKFLPPGGIWTIALNRTSKAAKSGLSVALLAHHNEAGNLPLPVQADHHLVHPCGQVTGRNAQVIG